MGLLKVLCIVVAIYLLMGYLLSIPLSYFNHKYYGGFRTLRSFNLDLLFNFLLWPIVLIITLIRLWYRGFVGGAKVLGELAAKDENYDDL